MKKTHKQLFKAEKMATIGTMADGLSHQINNRLHAMGFIAGDAIDSINIAQKKKQSKEASEVLTEIKESLEKIEDNVKRGGQIVEGLLKYTRKGEEGFEEVDFYKLVDAAFEMVQFKVKLRSLKLFVTMIKKVSRILLRILPNCRKCFLTLLTMRTMRWCNVGKN